MPTDATGFLTGVLYQDTELAGGEPKKITSEVPSFWHGWTPDSKTLAYCAERNGNVDIYTIGVEGGTEKRLTTTEGSDDGPDYSPDGSKPEQLTFDENLNWFAHPSPDNKHIVYIAYMSDEKQNHLFGKNVKLRLMDLKTKAIKDVTPVFYGGQGTYLPGALIAENLPSSATRSTKCKTSLAYGYPKTFF
ncbi:hypothetical protein GCM10028810_43140 [Spirosoma litoris]